MTESKSDQPCDCARLVGILDASEKKLPDHLCELTARRACLAWMRDHRVPPSPGARTFVVLGPGLFAEADQEGTWPLTLTDRHAGNSIVMVLRQWVEGPPDERLANLLESKHSEWLAALRELRRLAELVPFFETGDLEEWSPKHGWFGLETAREVLTPYHLPTTPRTLRYALWRLREGSEDVPADPPTWPSRGLVVNTLCIRTEFPIYEEEPIEGDRRKGYRQFAPWDGGGARPMLDGPLQWATLEEWEGVHATLRAHTRWWAKSPASRLQVGDKRKLNRRRPRQDELTDLIERYQAGGLDPGGLFRASAERRERRTGRALTDAEAKALNVELRRRTRGKKNPGG